MSEIKVLIQPPFIFTKDSRWAENNYKVEPGAIIVLPEDAVLYEPPTIVAVPQD